MSHFLRDSLDLGCFQGLGEKQPAERARPNGQQAFFRGGRRTLSGTALITWHEPVADPADGTPARQSRQQRGQRAGWQRLGLRAAGQGQEGFPVLVAADQARACREKQDRAAGAVPHPADGQRSRAVAGRSGCRVVGRDQGGEPLRPAGVVRLAPGRFCLSGIQPPRDFRNPVRVEPVQFLPG